MATDSSLYELALDNLCAYDKRSPYCSDLEDEEIRKPTDCHCDNCFYGRDKLANIILSLLDKGEIL